MNVLFISQFLNRAGTETFMMNVFRGVDKSRFHVDFLLFDEAETDYSREIEHSGGRVWRLISRRRGKINYYLQLNRFFKVHAAEYQVVHWCGNSLTSIAPIYYAWKYKVPIRILHSHNSSAYGLHNRLLHIVFRRLATCLSTHHLACSSAAAKWFFGNRKDSVIVKNGIDLTLYRFSPVSRKKIRQELGIAETTFVIGHIGSFSAIKNHEFLLDIFAQVLTTRPDSRLMLIGKGELEQHIREKAQQLDLASRILFLGECQNVHELLQAMDCFVMPSLFEGQPFVLVEAQAAGLSCFVSDSINKDIGLIKDIHFLPLSESANSWAEAITGKGTEFSHTDTTSELKNAGYDLADSIQQLQTIYQQK